MHLSQILLLLFWLLFLIGAVVKGKRTGFALPLTSQLVGACLLSAGAVVNWVVFVMLPLLIVAPGAAPAGPRAHPAWIDAWWSVQGFVLLAGALLLGVGYLVESIRTRPAAEPSLSEKTD